MTYPLEKSALRDSISRTCRPTRCVSSSAPTPTFHNPGITMPILASHDAHHEVLIMPIMSTS